MLNLSKPILHKLLIYVKILNDFKQKKSLIKTNFGIWKIKLFIVCAHKKFNLHAIVCFYQTKITSVRYL